MLFCFSVGLTSCGCGPVTGVQKLQAAIDVEILEVCTVYCHRHAPCHGPHRGYVPSTRKKRAALDNALNAICKPLSPASCATST